MIKKIHYFFIFFMLLQISIIQPVFAGFSIKVINKSDIAYEDIGLVITAVGFDGMYGRISLGEIKPHSTISQDFKYNYLTLPLTGVSMPSSLKECNLDVYIVASTKEASRPNTEKTFSNIIKSFPQTINEEEPFAFPERSRMKGIQPPNITITINTDGIIGDSLT